jgi:hypothetical protein
LFSWTPGNETTLGVSEAALAAAFSFSAAFFFTAFDPDGLSGALAAFPVSEEALTGLPSVSTDSTPQDWSLARSFFLIATPAGTSRLFPSI